MTLNEKFQDAGATYADLVNGRRISDHRLKAAITCFRNMIAFCDGVDTSNRNRGRFYLFHHEIRQRMYELEDFAQARGLKI